MRALEGEAVAPGLLSRLFGGRGIPARKAAAAPDVSSLVAEARALSAELAEMKARRAARNAKPK